MIKICVSLNEGQGQYNEQTVTVLSLMMMSSITSEKSCTRNTHTYTDRQTDKQTDRLTDMVSSKLKLMRTLQTKMCSFHKARNLACKSPSTYKQRVNNLFRNMHDVQIDYHIAIKTTTYSNQDYHI